MISPIRIAAYSDDVALTKVIRRQLFEVLSLECWRSTLPPTHFLQALQSF